MRFKEYSTLTAWDEFDSLDEDSDDDERDRPCTVRKSADLGPQLSSSPATAKVLPTADGTSPKLPSFDASPIKSSSVWPITAFDFFIRGFSTFGGSPECLSSCLVLVEIYFFPIAFWNRQFFPPFLTISPNTSERFGVSSLDTSFPECVNESSLIHLVGRCYPLNDLPLNWFSTFSISRVWG